MASFMSGAIGRSLMTSVTSGLMGFESAVAMSRGAYAYSPPAALGWPTTLNGKAVPQTFRKVGAAWEVADAGWTARDLINDGVWSAAPFYVDFSKANDTGDGLSWANAERSIGTGILDVNATSAPGRVIVRSGGSAPNSSQTPNGSGTTEPTQDIAILSDSGTIIVGARDAVTWPGTRDAEYPNTFEVTKAGAIAGLDMTTLDTYGLPLHIPRVADAATANSTLNSMSNVANVVNLRRQDDGTVTNANTWILLTTPVAEFDSSTVDIYIESVWFYGGQNGALWIGSQTAARNIVLVDVAACYGGRDSALFDGFRCASVNGLVYTDELITAYSAKDGTNFDNALANAGNMFVCQLNTISYGNGREPTSTNNNSWTSHDDVVAAVVGGYIGPSRGGASFQPIENTKTYVLGAEIVSSALNAGDQVAILANNSAIIWLENCTVTSTGVALRATDSAKIYHRNCTITGTIQTTGSGQVIEVAPNAPWPA